MKGDICNKANVYMFCVNDISIADLAHILLVPKISCHVYLHCVL